MLAIGLDTDFSDQSRGEDGEFHRPMQLADATNSPLRRSESWCSDDKLQDGLVLSTLLPDFPDGRFNI